MSTSIVDKTVDDIFSRIENLSDDQFIELEKRLYERRLEIRKAELLAEIRQIYADVPPISAQQITRYRTTFVSIKNKISFYPNVLYMKLNADYIIVTQNVN